MIDPTLMTRYGQQDLELEETLLFCCSVAGKNAKTTARLLEDFLQWGHLHLGLKSHYSPFLMIRHLGYQFQDLPLILKKAGFGCYNYRAKTFRALALSGLNLKTCTAEQLQLIPGIGMKTSHFFLLHTREDVQCPVIDTHALKFLTDMGYPIQEEKALTKKRYQEYSEYFLECWGDHQNTFPCTLAEYDLGIWNHYSEKSNKIETKSVY